MIGSILYIGYTSMMLSLSICFFFSLSLSLSMSATPSFFISVSTTHSLSFSLPAFFEYLCLSLSVSKFCSVSAFQFLSPLYLQVPDAFIYKSSHSNQWRSGGVGRPGRQNYIFGVDEMVSMKVFKGRQYFWLRRKGKNSGRQI